MRALRARLEGYGHLVFELCDLRLEQVYDFLDSPRRLRGTALRIGLGSKEPRAPGVYGQELFQTARQLDKGTSTSPPSAAPDSLAPITHPKPVRCPHTRAARTRELPVRESQLSPVTKAWPARTQVIPRVPEVGMSVCGL